MRNVIALITRDYNTLLRLFTGGRSADFVTEAKIIAVNAGVEMQKSAGLKMRALDAHHDQ